MIGKKAPVDRYIEDVYILMLDAWYGHLRCGESERLSDYVSLSQEELLKEINCELNKYTL